jgi:hypothetical protein
MASKFGGVPVDAPVGGTQSKFGGIPADDSPPPPAPTETGPVDFDAAEMVKNIPSSAMNMLKDAYSAVRHPVDTFQGVADLARSGQRKITELSGGNLDYFDKRGVTTDQVGQFVDFLGKRYGSVDAAKKTLQEDPVGVMADFASLVSGAGSTLRLPGVAKVGAALDPVNAAVNTTLYGAGKALPKDLPKQMYESAAKLSTTIPEERRASMVKTALDNELPPTSKGVKKLEGMIQGLNETVDGLISKATSEGKSVPIGAIYKELKSLRRRKGGMSLDAPGDTAAISKIIGDFQKHLKAKGKTRLSAAELQELKVNAYKSINWDAKRMTGTPIKEDVYRAVAKGAKENIQDMVPGVGASNKALSDLYDLQPNLQRSANRIENKNALSITDPLNVTAGTVAGGPVGAAVATVISILGKDAIKAKNAIRLERLSKNANFQRFLKNNPNVSKARLAAIISGRQTLEEEETP